MDAEVGEEAAAQGDEGGVAGVAGPCDGDGDVGDEPTVAQDGDPVGEAYRLVDVVGDEQDRGVVDAAELADEVLHTEPGQRVERGERLVEEEKFGLPDQRPCQRDALGLAAGQGGRPGVGMTVEADLGEGPQAGRPGRRPARQPDGHIAEDLRGGDEPGLLEDDRAGGGDEGLSPVGAVEAAEDAQQGRLAAAARPEQGEELAAREGEVQAVEDGAGTEDAAQAPYPYGCGCGCGRGCGRAHRVPPPGPAVRQGMRIRSSPRTRTSAVRPSSPYTRMQTARMSVRA